MVAWRETSEAQENLMKDVFKLAKYHVGVEDFIISVEATGNYGVTLAYFLLSQGYKLVEINPYRANQFRKA